MCEKYNGWTNYETWNVNLWLSNDEGSVQMALDTVEGLDDYDAGQALKALVEEENPLAGDASMFADMLGAALSTVNWREVAEHFREDEDKEAGQ